VRLYFDNNATTPALPEVVAAMVPFFAERFGNPSSAHGLGEDAADAVRAARASVARLFGAKSSSEVVFTSGGTESINTAIHAAVVAAERDPARRTIVTSTVEHSAVLGPIADLEERGFHVVRVGVDADGRLDRAAIERALAGPAGRACALVALMLANNETGVIADLEGVGALCRASGATFFVDAVQAAGKIPLDVGRIGADMVSISAHKLHGPKGAGALWVRPGVECPPLLRGGSQEKAVRPGTENVPAIVGFGRAAEAALSFAGDEKARARVLGLRDRLEQGILAGVPFARANGARSPRVPNTTNISFAGVEAEELLALLSSQELYASAGSACHAQARKPSHVLLAMGLDADQAASCVRFSLSRDTTAEEVDTALAIVLESVSALRATA
jgi:cysteine desulfurase